MKELAIVIVSFNARADLEACLAALADHPPSTPHEIVVIDNASTDGSPAAVRTRWPTVTVTDAGDNLGFARATNLGIRATASRFLLFLNPDTLPLPRAIDRLVGILLARTDVAIVGPRLVDADGALEVSFGSMMSPVAELWQKCLVRGHAARLPLLADLVERRAGAERLVDWVSGACLLVRRPDAEAAGLLDERFFPLRRGRRLLRRGTRSGTTRPLYPGRRGGASPRPFRAQRAGAYGGGLSPQSAGLLPEAPPHMAPCAPDVSSCVRQAPRGRVRPC